MSTLIVKLDPEDTILIAREVAAEILKHVGEKGAEVVLDATTNGSEGGIEVLTVREAAECLGVSESHLDRLHAQGEKPLRRRITPRRVVYFRHELVGEPEARVLERSRRVLNLSTLAEKLRVSRPTARSLFDQLPPRNTEGEWYEREIDDWLLRRPRA